MNYQLYQILLFFAIYCIIGWVINSCYFVLVKGFYDNRSVTRKPILPSCGLGAVIILYEQMLVRKVEANFTIGQLMMTFVLAVITALAINLSNWYLINGLCGEKLVNIHWHAPFLWGIGGIILVYHLHPLIELVTDWISPWIHMIFLIFFSLKFLPQLIDGLAKLKTYKKKSTFLKEAE